MTIYSYLCLVFYYWHSGVCYLSSFSSHLLIFICRQCPVYFSYELLLLLVGKWSGLLALLKTSARRLHPTFSDPLNLKLHSFKMSEQWGGHFEKLLKNAGPSDQPVPQDYGEFLSRLLDRQPGPEKNGSRLILLGF